MSIQRCQEYTVTCDRCGRHTRDDYPGCQMHYQDHQSARRDLIAMGWSSGKPLDDMAVCGPCSLAVEDEVAAERDASRDFTHEPTAGELGIASPPHLTEADYPEDKPGRDPHCGLTHGHSPTAKCSGR